MPAFRDGDDDAAGSRVHEERVLLLPPTRRDADAIQKLLAESNMACVVCGSMSELCRELERGAGAMLVSEEAITADPHEFTHRIANQPVWSDIPTIVLSRSGSESPNLAPLLLTIGNVSVMERPVRLSTFRSAVQSALRNRARQYQVRDHLACMEETDRALRRSHDAFFTLVDRAPFGVYVVDSRLRIHSVNRVAQSVFQNVQPLIGRDFVEAMRILWPQPFAEEAVARFRHTLKTGESYVAPSVTETRRDVGVVQSYEWELHRIALPDGTFGVVCYYYESTELRAIEAKLREARRKSEAALLAGEIGTYYWDIVANRLSGDVNFLSMFGIELDTEGGAPLEEFMQIIHQDDQAGVARKIRATLDTDEPFVCEYRILHPAGERWVVSRGVVERNENGEPIGWPGVVVNITERKRIEEERRELLESERVARTEAERASRMKDEFLATLSHEIRTPLNAILGWAHILGRGKSGSADIANGLAVIERNARAQTQIISDLLDMNRIINGKIRLDVQSMSVGAVVQAAIDTVTPAADAKGVRLEVSLDPSGGFVHGDSGRLQQVFWNLLSNAVKFTPRGECVHVTMERTESQLEVRVIDTGEGISPEFLPYVFDRFRQADGSTTRRHGGLGLGLAIVKQLVELHGGSVRALSDGPGKGATFIVTLPLSVVRSEPEYESGPRAGAGGPGPSQSEGFDEVSGLRVLVVDDEPDSRELVQRLLEGCNATVTIATSAKEAVMLVRQMRPDVLISDIGMPGEDGYSLIRQVRAMAAEHGGRTVAVALTAYARTEDRANAARAGFQYYMSKPVEPAELIATVASAARAVKGTAAASMRAV